MKIDTNIARASQLIQVLMKAAPGKPPKPHLFWYEPTHRWRKKPEAGGSFSEKDLHIHVEKNLKSLQRSVRNFLKANPDSEAAKIMNPVVDRLGNALEGKNTYAEILYAINETNKLHSSKLFSGLRNKFWKLHELVHEGEEPSGAGDKTDWVVNETQARGLNFRLSETINILRNSYLKMMNAKMPHQKRAEMDKAFGDFNGSIMSMYKSLKSRNLGEVYDELYNVESQMNDVRKTIPKRQKVAMRMLEDAQARYKGFITDIEYRNDRRLGGPRTPKKSAATGNILKEAPNLPRALASWRPQIIYNGKYPKAESERMSDDVAIVTANVKPELQRQLQDMSRSVPTKAYSKSEWTTFAKSKNYNPQTLGGLCNSKTGVHLPHTAPQYVTAHEYGHFMDQRKIGKQGFSKLKSRFYDLAGKNKGFISSYSKTNPNEFVAEVFAHYITDPAYLKRIDPVSFDIIKEHLAQ